MNNTKNKKNILKILGIIFLISFVACLSLSTYVGLKLLSPKRINITKTPTDYNLKYDNVQFKSAYDNINLKGFYIPKENANEAIIIAHGYRKNRNLERIDGLKLVKKLHDKGNYNILMFDFRCSGESEGDFASIGLYEKYDLLSAIDFAKEKYNNKKIHLLGFSMGASTALMAGVESVDVETIIADSPFDDLRTYLEENMTVWTKLPDFPFTQMILSTLPKLKGVDVNKVSPIKDIVKLNEDKYKYKKLLLIHSKDDEAIPLSKSLNLYEKVKNNKNIELFETKGALHTESFTHYQDIYVDKVLEIINKES